MVPPRFAEQKNFYVDSFPKFKIASLYHVFPQHRYSAEPLGPKQTSLKTITASRPRSPPMRARPNPYQINSQTNRL
jgi:hypothetical protein